MTIQSGINEPRHPTLPNIIKAKKKPIDIKTAADLDIDTIGHTSLVKIYTPKNNSKAEMLEGDIETVARSLIKKLTTDVAVI